MRRLAFVLLVVQLVLVPSLSLRAAPPLSPPPIPEVLKSAKPRFAGWPIGGGKETVLVLESPTPLTDEQWAAIEALGIRQFNLSGRGFGDVALARLVKLDPTALFLWEMPITDDGAARFGEMKSLRALTVVHAGAQITTKSGGVLENHPALEALVAPAAWAADPETFARIFKSCKRLRFTQLGHHLACDTNCASLANHPAMADIYLMADPNGSLSDAGLAALATMPELTSLHVRFARFTYDGSLAQLKRVPKLAKLRFEDTVVSDEDLQRLKADLPAVAITYTEMKPDILVKLETAEAVRKGQAALTAVADVLSSVKPTVTGDPATRGGHLTLASGTASLTDEQWTAVESLGIRSLGLMGRVADERGLARVARLDPVSLRIGGVVTDAGLAHLAGMKSLRTVDLGSCSGATAASAAVVANHPAIETLTPLNAWATDAAALTTILKNPRLTGITLVQRQVNDAACRLLARHPEFERISLQPLGMPGLTNDALVSLATLPKLAQLDLSFSRFTFDGGLEHLVKLPRLATLSLSQAAVSQEDVERLQAALPKTRIIFTPMAPAAREVWEKQVAAREKAAELATLPEPDRAARLAALQQGDPAAFGAVQAELRSLWNAAKSDAPDK